MCVLVGSVGTPQLVAPNPRNTETVCVCHTRFHLDSITGYSVIGIHSTHTYRYYEHISNRIPLCMLRNINVYSLDTFNDVFSINRIFTQFG